MAVSPAHGLAEGAIAGLNGAACMSVFREVLRRRGLIEAMPPQALRAALERRGGARGNRIGRHLSDHAVHLAISIVAGAGYGAVWGRSRRPSFRSGILYGLGVWAVGLLAFIPLLGVRRVPAHTGLPQNTVNLVAHGIYGAVLSLLVQGMRADDRRRMRRADDDAARIG